MQVPSGESSEPGGTVEGMGTGTALQGQAGVGSSKESQDWGQQAQSWRGILGSCEVPREADGGLL